MLQNAIENEQKNKIKINKQTNLYLIIRLHTMGSTEEEVHAH
jgi:hypothetical protein